MTTKWLRLAAGFALTSAAVIAQEDRERRIRTTEFLEKRAAPAKLPATRQSLNTALPIAEGPVLGLTLWRLREPQSADRIRLLFHDGAPNQQELTPERISVQSPLNTGDRIRISLEAARGGFLYILSRERYKDGSHGTPYLIFPSRRIWNGDNEVRAGKIVEVPEWSNATPYFKLVSTRVDQEGEELIVLITPAQLRDLITPGPPMPVADATVQDWLKRYGGSFKTLDAVNLRGAAMNEAEKAASLQGKMLTEKDPPPQTIFTARSDPKSPFLITVTLKVN